MLDNNFRKVVPYVPGEQPKDNNIIKLNTNENPYPPSPMVLDALNDVNTDSFRKYPDPEVSELVETIAEYHNVDKENVFIGVGSDDVLAMCFLAFFNSGKEILFPDVSYAFYKVWADLFGIKYREVSLNDKFQIETDDYFVDNGGVIFPNPNAPTGLVMSLSDIENILIKNQHRVVIVDEAYIDFGGNTALALVEKFDNLIVTRTFSKSRSMAGMRIGYCIGNEELISVLNSVKFSFNSYTMSDIAIKCGIASIKDEYYFKNTVSKIIETREKTKSQLTKLGFEFLDSSANFIFAKHNEFSGEELFNALKENKIFVRHFNSDRISDYLRITVGTDLEMKKLISFLSSYIRSK